ncbi:tRNA-specific 2-thiouridylase MnmA [Desulfosarcina alkanivorans]|jgi:tRNA-specific 2-thiouridylase|uniref:tRNA-specific 2-thiouridylase MnmA n=1 Tax=Desulfosarcina alkanivorans TaxID=571177 RepID=A0A5K7YFI1_9BACT|nr:tRNA 2-thiouridine(34) synthase MnmA [Desulfosarcina alkanivorans]BBO67333.1 tRNA-specific 2-thiouridylase MnmA [Desulfosarcina alkanivorans]
MTGPVAIAVSGGIDSLVCADLVQRQGVEVFGIHFLTGFEKPAGPGSEEIQAVFRPLDIPVAVIDLKSQFKTMVVDYFAAAYQDGETPNPCLVCNPLIKFGVLLEKARQLGASHLATGHYARVDADRQGRYRLRRGIDESKDQSYFLSRLTQDQLARACFPLGTWTKDRVRALAAEKGLQPVSRKESQDVCFIKDVTYADFLIQAGGVRPQAGDIVDTAGHRIGTHHGLHRYTVGQRRGINCPASQAWYVVRIDARQNRLVVGTRDELATNSCRVRDINWIARAPEEAFRAHVRIRYRHRAVAAAVSPDGRDGAVVRFDQPQAAVTPGQGAVFYRGDEVLGGGWIAAE